MKTITYIILLAFLTFCTGYFLPQWWLIAFISFLIALVFKEGMIKSALLGLIVVTVVWFAVAYHIDSNNDSILSTRIGNLFGGVGPIWMSVISALIGGIVSMFGALTGASLNTAISQD